MRKFHAEFKSLIGFDFSAFRMVSQSAISHIENLLIRLTRELVSQLLRTQRPFARLDRVELAAVKQGMLGQFSSMEMKLPT
jgi:hypothetical protein